MVQPAATHTRTGPTAGGRSTSIGATQGATTIDSFSYALDPNGQVTSVTSSGVPPDNHTYGYNNLNQLTQVDSSPIYTYDQADNPTLVTGPTNQAFDRANQLCWTASTTGTNCTAPPTGATTYSYDNRGDLTTITPPSGPATTLSYDQATRLTSNGNGTSYTYNGDGLRMTKTTGTATANYTYDQADHILVDGTTNYIYGPDGSVLEQITGTIPTWYHHDRLGSTRVLTDNTGAIVGAFTYDPYGSVTASTGTATTPIGYAGGYKDSESGFVYLINRYYNPAIAQFLTVDPLVNVTEASYTYAGDDPLNGADALGLCWPSWACGAEHAVGHLATSATNALEGDVREGAHLAVDAVTDPFYLSYWGALDLNGIIHAGLGRIFGRVGCDIANVIGAPLVPVQAVGLGVDVGGDWIKEHLLDISNYTVGDEGIPNAFLLGSQVGPIAKHIGINWRHNFPGVHANGSIDWWW